jgi:phage gp36-like protein
VGKYIDQSDLEAALSTQTIAQIFAHPVTGAVDPIAVELIIDNAEAEVDSFLLGYIEMPLKAPYDRLVRLCALDFATVFAFRRNPEYVRTFGEDVRAWPLYAQAVDRMRRIQASAQRLSDNEGAGGAKPATVGGSVSSMVDDISYPNPPKPFFMGGIGDF